MFVSGKHFQTTAMQQSGLFGQFVNCEENKQLWIWSLNSSDESNLWISTILAWKRLQPKGKWQRKKFYTVDTRLSKSSGSSATASRPASGRSLSRCRSHKHPFNRTASIRHLFRKTTVLSYHGCLINTGAEKMSNI